MARPALPKGQGTRVFSGARCIFLFNGEQVGFANGISGSEEIQYEPIDVLDHLDVQEFVPVAYRVTFSAQVFYTVAQGASDDINAPGSLKQQQIFPNFDDIFRIQGVDAVIQDDRRVSGKLLEQFHDVKTATRNFNIQPRAVVGQNVGFVARRLMDVSEINP